MLREVHDALPGIEVIPSNGGSKEAAADRHGLLVNIWIDDMPGIIPADY